MVGGSYESGERNPACRGVDMAHRAGRRTVFDRVALEKDAIVRVFRVLSSGKQ